MLFHYSAKTAFSTDHGLDPTHVGSAFAKAHKKLVFSEAMLSYHASGCDFFAISENTLPENVAKKIISQALRREPSEVSIAGIREGQEAVHSFLQIASGVSADLQGHLSVERFRKHFQLADEASSTGPVLQYLFQRSLWLHEKIRIETEFFQFSANEAAIFRELIGKIFGDIGKLVVGWIGDSNRSAQLLISELHRAGIPTVHRLAAAAHDEHQSQFGDIPLTQQPLTPEEIERTDILLIFEENYPEWLQKSIADRMSHRNSAPFAIYSESQSLHQQIARKKIYNVFNYSRQSLGESVDRNKSHQRHIRKQIDAWIQAEADDYNEWQASKTLNSFAGMIGTTAGMRRVFELISRIAQTEVTILIQGESGTGKELVARAIHKLSSRNANPFVVVNCGAIPDNLLESELFGHEKGAFTGAISSQAGLFSEAEKGTIFLDEIGELPLHLQVKLLRFLQEGEIKPVGSNKTIHVDLRVLAATNRNLEEMVESGQFRSDLYYRLNVIQVPLPTLLERMPDVPPLATHFLKRFSKKFRKDVRHLSDEALAALESYSWPGNVRELENAIEHGVALCNGETVVLQDLPSKLQSPPAHFHPQNGAAQLTLKELEKEHILKVLADCQDDHEKAAQRLGIGRTTLWRKLREYYPEADR